MNIDNKCIVIFPIYKSLSKCARECFEQSVKMTKGYRQVFIAPTTLNLDDSFGSLRSLDIIRFDDSFFRNIKGYNLLMLSTEFYKVFSSYEYMLICQSDAYLFKPELDYWCAKGYDYIGAPWFQPDLSRKIKIKIFKAKYLSFLYSPDKKESKKHYLFYNEIGNGGLSLRKISTFIKVLEKAPRSLIELYGLMKNANYGEDVFWSYEAPLLYSKFIKPTIEVALRFSFEQNASVAYQMNNQELPFGCHAFNIIETDFWKRFIPPLND